MNAASDLHNACRAAIKAAGLESGLHCTPGALTGRESGEADVALGFLDGIWCVHVRLGGEMVGTWTPGTNAARLTGRAKKAALALQKRQAEAVLRIAQIAVADALRALEAA